MRSFAFSLLVSASLWSGCTVRPDGESGERDRAAAAGTAYAKPFAERELPELAPEAALPAWIAHAELANGMLEAAFHRWVAALEQVPQASTQDATAMLGAEHRFAGGDALDRTGLMLMSDTMNNLLLPGRLAARGEAALARARAAAAEFDRTRLALQREVAEAYWALALRDEEIRLQQELRSLLAVQVASVRGAVAAGRSGQTELLAAEVALQRVEAALAGLRGGRPALAEALRARVGASAPEEPRPALVELRPLDDGERRWIDRALAQNPDLVAARAERAAALAEITDREWMRVPMFSLRGLLMGDGVLSLAGAVTLPFLRGTAIEAGVRQAQAEARAAEALERQAGSDAVAGVVAATATLRAAAAESELLREGVLPKLRQMADVARATWSAGRGSFAAWVEPAAMVVEVETMVARLARDGLVARAELAEAVGGM